MAAYRRVDDLRSPAGWLPVHRDQLRAQRSVSSMGSLYLFYLFSACEVHNQHEVGCTSLHLFLYLCSFIRSLSRVNAAQLQCESITSSRILLAAGPILAYIITQSAER